MAVLGVSLRTCFVTLSQHFTLLDVALEEGDVVVEVCATASPKLPVSIAAAINPIPAIRMRHPPWLDWSGECSHIPKEKRHPAAAVPRPLRDQKEPRSRYRGLSSAAMEQGPRCVNRASVASHGPPAGTVQGLARLTDQGDTTDLLGQPHQRFDAVRVKQQLRRWTGKSLSSE